MSTPGARQLLVDAAEYAATEARLRALVRTTRDVILLQGESIVALEAMARGVGAPTARAVNVITSPYGAALGRWLAAAGASVENIDVGRQRGVRLHEVEAALERGGVDIVSVVHAEAATGALQPRRGDRRARARRGRARARRRGRLDRRRAARDRRVGPRPHGAERAEGARRACRRLRRRDQRPGMAGDRGEPGRPARLGALAARLARALDPARAGGRSRRSPTTWRRARSPPRSTESSRRAWTPPSAAISAPATRRAPACARAGSSRGSPTTPAPPRSRRSSAARPALEPADLLAAARSAVPEAPLELAPGPLATAGAAHRAHRRGRAPRARAGRARGLALALAVAWHRRRRRRGARGRGVRLAASLPPERGPPAVRAAGVPARARGSRGRAVRLAPERDCPDRRGCASARRLPAGGRANRMPACDELAERVAEHLAVAVVSRGSRNLLAGARFVSEHVLDAAG